MRREGGDEGDLGEGDEMFLRALENSIRPSIAAEPGEGPFDHPADALSNIGTNELSTNKILFSACPAM